MRGKNDQQNGNATYIAGLAVLFFDELSKKRKRQKEKVQPEREWEKNTKYTVYFYKVHFLLHFLHHAVLILYF